MSRKKIVIVSMRSWGEVGNYLCAQQFSQFLESKTTYDTVLVAADDYSDLFRSVGKKIKRLTMDSKTADERKQRYSSMMKRLDHDLCALENGRGHEESALMAEVARHDPDYIICTKGVISRYLSFVNKEKGDKQYLFINYVTNHGHFNFSAHLTPRVRHFITRLNEGSEFIENLQSVVSNPNIYELGFISNFSAPAVASYSRRSKPLTHVIIVSNRGDSGYLELARKLLNESNIKLIYISINNPFEHQRLLEIKAAIGAEDRLAVYEKMSHYEYIKLLVETNSTGAIYVGKGSINTLLEALILFLPVFGIRSGLPMEEWGADYLSRHGVGEISDNINYLGERILTVIANPHLLVTYFDAIDKHNTQLRLGYDDRGHLAKWLDNIAY